jgi:hypothetical protein
LGGVWFAEKNRTPKPFGRARNVNFMKKHASWQKDGPAGARLLSKGKGKGKGWDWGAQALRPSASMGFNRMDFAHWRSGNRPHAP